MLPVLSQQSHPPSRLLRLINTAAWAKLLGSLVCRRVDPEELLQSCSIRESATQQQLHWHPHRLNTIYTVVSDCRLQPHRPSSKPCTKQVELNMDCFTSPTPSKVTQQLSITFQQAFLCVKYRGPNWLQYSRVGAKFAGHTAEWL